MSNQETKKVSKLNDIDRHVLLVYSNISLETGAKISAGATETKTIHNNAAIKV